MKSDLLADFAKIDNLAISLKTSEDLDSIKLFPEEKQLLSPKAVAKRKREFFLGRGAAHEALKKMAKDFPILRGKSNEPLWPKGIVGSITHCREIAIAAVSRQTYYHGIGIDLEELNREVSLDIARLVCLPQEKNWVEQSNALHRLLSLFSAKEATFKVFFPREKVFLDFKDALLTWQPEENLFQGQLLKAAGHHFPENYRFQVHCRNYQDYVFSYLLLPPFTDYSEIL